MKPYSRLSLDKVKTNSVYHRTNLVNILNMSSPYQDQRTPWKTSWSESQHFDQLIDHIVHTRASGKPVIWSMGAHVIKNGMSRYVIEMVRHGILTHVSGNGATSIHDFELAFLGETSEDVARTIEDGSFGMWEETGRLMNEAIQQGFSEDWGYGESLYRYSLLHSGLFLNQDDCVFIQCHRLGIPYTCHISIGTDIIHQHPIVNFEALGRASGKDFQTICSSIAEMDEGGVFLNFGSAISGPEIFLKGVTLSRNQGLAMKSIIAANFDIVPVNQDVAPSRQEAEFYYRPRRNFIDRLSQIDGHGYLFHGLHQVTIPHLFHRILQRKQELGVDFPPYVRTEKLSPHRSKLYSVIDRQAELKAEPMNAPDEDSSQQEWPDVKTPSFIKFVNRVREALQQGKEVLISLGGNVIGSGVSQDLIDLINQGCITHLAMNGAVAFQDLELAAFGQTEEKDINALREGKLHMWEEPGTLLHRILKEGYERGLGYGESLVRDMLAHPEIYPYHHLSLLYACGQRGIPCTVHVTLGTDAIQLHPDTDFAVQGGASGRDFCIYAHTVSRLDGGVFANFGSTVTGPEVFLKALSIARNLKYTVQRITTANFDIVKLGDYHKKVGYEDWDYYYRPRKNIIHRPTSLGGEGYHFEGLHQQTIPALKRQLFEIYG